MSPYTLRKHGATALLYVVLLVFAVFFFFPLVFMIISSFKPEKVIFDDLATVWKAFVPTTFTLENFHYVFNRVPFWRFMINSLLVTVLTVSIGLLLNSMLAYSLARLTWPGKKLVLMVIIALAIVPLETVAIPMLVMVNGFWWFDGSRSWLDTYRVQIIPFITDAMSTFMFYQFFLGLPRPIDEAAYMEGCHPFQVYTKIVVPLSRPVFATVTILNSLAIWNSYLWPLMVTRTERVRPLPIGITALYVLNMRWGYILAFASLITVPILILFLVFQKWFVASITSSGVKG
ncbi:MAG: carbohydrate ABC transporter permease [Chloroflexota bacterium]